MKRLALRFSKNKAAVIGLTVLLIVVAMIAFFTIA